MIKPDLYAIAGHPIGHSRSPFIHARFAEQTGENIRYDALDVPPESFDRLIGGFRDAGGRGMNITVPLKELAFAYAGAHTDRARRAGAVNTLRFERDAEVLGDNTDGPGLIRDLSSNIGIQLEGRRILLLGAGGAARGVLGPLLDERPECVIVANRTASRARSLATDFEGGGEVRACALDDIPPVACHLVINATSTGLSGATLPLQRHHLTPDALCYDMMYGAQPTAFLRQACELGAARAVDGRGMLVEQAAESFLLWRGKRPDTGPVIEALGRLLGAG